MISLALRILKIARVELAGCVNVYIPVGIPQVICGGCFTQSMALNGWDDDSM